MSAAGPEARNGWATPRVLPKRQPMASHICPPCHYDNHNQCMETSTNGVQCACLTANHGAEVVA